MDVFLTLIRPTCRLDGFLCKEPSIFIILQPFPDFSPLSLSPYVHVGCHILQQTAVCGNERESNPKKWELGSSCSWLGNKLRDRFMALLASRLGLGMFLMLGGALISWEKAGRSDIACGLREKRPAISPRPKYISRFFANHSFRLSQKDRVFLRFE